MPNFTNMFTPPQKINYTLPQNNWMGAALQQSQQQAQQGQQANSNSMMNNISSALRNGAKLIGTDGADILAGMNLGGAGDALAMSPLFGGAMDAAAYGGGVSSSVLPGIFPGAQVGLETGSGAFGGGSATGAFGGGSSAAAGGAGGSAGLAALTAAPFAIAAMGMLNGIMGRSDDGNAYTQAQDALANALLKNPDVLKQTNSQDFGQGTLDAYMQNMFGGRGGWNLDQYQKAKDALAAAGGGGSFFSNFLGGAEQGMGG